MENNVQGSITVRRLRNGDSLFITFDTNGIDLYQGIDPTTGAVTPDWTIAGNQPIRTPRVTSARGNAVSITEHEWYKSGAKILFTVNKGGNIMEDATGTFSLNTATGALRILKNIASKTVVGSVNLKWSGKVYTGGTEQTLNKDTDIKIGLMGASSAFGTLISSTEQLSADVPTTEIASNLYLGPTSAVNYYARWWRDDQPWTAKDGQKKITVTRDDVSGAQLFICKFYNTQSDTTPIAVAGKRIIDIADEYQVPLRITSANKEVDTGKPVTVQAYIYNSTTGVEVNPSGQVWKLTAYVNGGDFTPVKTSNTSSIQITTAETDRDGNQYDIDIIGEVTF
ncbi:hypothetical protein [Bacteroides sp.]|uniref:hypothetical protein n=1 Tax=Bacteroides sp. TaxID=29523 RepID=UPI0026345C6E|nr:hypothetical protein [Bacteroides sp.]MDD3040308.1 hypothetical protein [Bacteroides sp.]